MAQYTVIQDIEAEDKFVGPLTLKQFIYAAITVVLLYLSFILITKHLWPLATVLIPPAIFFGFLAFPWGRDQPTEIWLLAKLRFFLKPRRRIWNQSGVQELVTITAPKAIEKNLSDGLDQTQVKSRLQALAQTIDTRGWAVKGVDVNMYASPTYTPNDNSDRLVSANELAQVSAPQSTFTLSSTDDILDTKNNPIAQQMDLLVKAKDEAHRVALLDNMQRIRSTAQENKKPNDNFLGQQFTEPPRTPAQSYPTAQQKPPATGTHTLKPDSPAPGNDKPNPAILELANNDDLSVATIARQASKKNLPPDGEVVISLR